MISELDEIFQKIFNFNNVELRKNKEEINSNIKEI